MRIAALVLVVLAVLTAPLGWYLAQRALRDGTPTPPPPDPAVAALTETVEALGARVDGLEARLALGLPQGLDRTDSPASPAEDGLKDSFAQVVLIADRRDVNAGLSVATPAFLNELLGAPREDLTDECLDMTNPTLAAMLKVEDVGPINVKMLNPALLSLRQVFKNVEVYEPELYARIRSAGSLCVRRIRGSDAASSSHAYGLAVDLNIDGVLDTLGDGKSQLGLILLSDFFQKEGWIWGAGFGREDSMHFEVSREKLDQWRRLGQI